MFEDFNESREPEYADIPPVLPAKRGSLVQEESADNPPPLPAKKGATSTSSVGELSLAGGDLLCFLSVSFIIVVKNEIIKCKFHVLCLLPECSWVSLVHRVLDCRAGGS